ncbi:MAG: LysR family transcriptional regulator [Actinobacteria bacterium]|nr:LysR family transcriptional regulator [Actinomycetota bacterium]
MHSDVLIQQLEYLIALSRERHFGRAAAACHVSQPTLSVAIRRLESELGVVIVLRGRRFEGFTEEGSRVLTWAHRILAERDELLADVERMRGRLSTMARVGAIPTSVPVSPLLTAPFLRDHPAASIRIEATSSREIARRLADFEFDAGLTYLDDETPPGSRRFLLYRERYVLLAPAAHPLMRNAEVRWSDAAKLPLCALTPAMRNRRIIDGYMAAEGAWFQPAVEADTVGALYAHLAASELATVASHTWLHAFGVPRGMAVRPMVRYGAGPAVGLIILDRRPTSIVAEALVAAAATVDFAAVLQSALDTQLGEPVGEPA